jgi:predicted ATPase
LIGRQDELATLHDLLQQPAVRLVTLLGPGGVGKTRLALALAATLSEAFPDGVAFVDLTPLVDPGLVPTTILAGLGIGSDAGDPTERLVAALAGKRLLLVFDNFEQVVAAAPVVGAVITRAPTVTVLATSRVPLRVYGEHEQPVAPLSLPDRQRLPSLGELPHVPAIRLFLDRATAVKPEFALTEHNAPAVAEICTRLDGLPLAIELAAARVKLLPPQALLGRLERRLPLLTGGARTLPVRQQTMRDAVGWSYGLLGSEAQTLFRRLGVFVSGWTLESADAVAGFDGVDVFGGLGALVDASLVRQEEANGEPRFRMLETVREFALERLTHAGERTEVQAAHADYFVTQVDASAQQWPLAGPGDADLDRLAREHDNLRAVLAWAVEQNQADLALHLAIPLAELWFARGHIPEGLAWFARILALPPPVDRAMLARGLAYVAALGARLGRPEAVEAGRASWRIWEEIGGSPTDRAAAAQQLGVALDGIGEHAEAEIWFGRARDGFRTARDPSMLATALINLAIVARLQGDPTRGEAPAAEALALLRGEPHPWVLGLTLVVSGDLARDRGDWATGLAHYRETLVINRSFGDVGRTADALSGIALVASAFGEHLMAVRLLAASAQLRQAIGQPIARWIKAEVDAAIGAERAAMPAGVFAAAWEAGSRLDHINAIEQGLAAGDDLLQGRPA